MSPTDAGPPRRTNQDPARRGVIAGGRPTVRDVADVAGVSFKTVARVVNGEPGVRPETAERVMAAVRQLGFRRNAVAANFARGISGDTIGLVIDDVSNPFFATLTRAIEDVTRARGLQVIIASSDREPQRERSVIESLVAQRLGGLLVVPVGRDHRYLAREVRLGTAVVFLDRPQGYLRADTITVDNYGGARQATEHLIGHGHRRIAALAHPDIYTSFERLRGYQDALNDADIPVDPALIRPGLGDVDDVIRAMTDLLERDAPPTAVFAGNNRMAVGAIEAITKARRRVAVVGFDDFELATALATPVSVIRIDVRELGRLGAELLLRRMSGWDAEPEKIVLPTELVVRGSGEIAPDQGQDERH
jgi:LacI family transcriptional regulator